MTIKPKQWDDLKHPGRVFWFHFFVRGDFAQSAQRDLAGTLAKVRRPARSVAASRGTGPAPELPAAAADELRVRLSTTGNEPATHLGMSGAIEGPLAVELGKYFDALPPGRAIGAIADESGEAIWSTDEGFAAAGPVTFASVLPHNLQPITGGK